MDSAILTPKSLTSSASSSATQWSRHAGTFLHLWHEAPKETVLPERGRAAETGTREEYAWGAAAAMAVAARERRRWWWSVNLRRVFFFVDHEFG